MGIYDDDGNLIPGVESAQDLQDRLSKLDTLSVEVEKLQNKDLNFGKLRTQLEEKEAKTKELEEKLKQKEEEGKTVAQKELQEAQEAFISVAMQDLSIEDEELKEKVKYHYKRIKDEAKTREEVAEKMKDAYILATKNSAVLNPISRAASASGRSGGGGASQTDAAKAIASRFGVSEADANKYGSDSWAPSKY